MASLTDKITDTRNAARPNSARVASGRSAGGTTLTCDNLTGWPTASKVHGVTYQIDSTSTPVAGTQLDFHAIRSGNDLTSFTVIDGSDTGNAVNDVVEMLPTAAWGQDLSDALMVGHDRTGVHKSGATYPSPTLSGTVSGTYTLGGTLTINSPTIATPTIASFANATHTHANAAGGGVLPFVSGAQTATVATSETTTSTTYVDLSTVGPSVTVTIGASGLALVVISSQASNNTSGQNVLINPVLSGANVVTASTNEAVGGWNYQTAGANQAFEASYTRLFTGLTPGSTTFKVQYRVTGGTGSFARRYITVVPL